MGIYEICLLFFVYAFLGWCTEVSFAAVCRGVFVNRGFLNGPWCPVYGFGVVVVILALAPIADNLLLLFVGAVLLTTAIEFAAGYLLEKLFGARWWDYRDEPFNIKGYVCPKFSLMWGLACVFVIRLIHPPILKLIRWLPHTLGVVLICCLCVLLAVDLCATVLTVRKLKIRLRLIAEMAAEIREFSDRIGAPISERSILMRERLEDMREDLEDNLEEMQAWVEEQKEDARERREDRQEKREELKAQMQKKRDELEALLREQRTAQRRLVRAFPTLRFHDLDDALEQLKEALDAKREKK